MTQPAEPAASQKAKRRWYQFSLRTMLFLLTLFAAGFARVAYLRNRASYHERKATECARMWEWYCSLSPEELDDMATQAETHKNEYHFTMAREHRANAEENGGDGYFEILLYHRRLAREFRDAAYRPWKLVDSTAPILPVPSRKPPEGFKVFAP